MCGSLTLKEKTFLNFAMDLKSTFLGPKLKAFLQLTHLSLCLGLRGGTAVLRTGCPWAAGVAVRESLAFGTGHSQCERSPLQRAECPCLCLGCWENLCFQSGQEAEASPH